MKIIPVKYGESVLSEALIVQGGNANKFCHIPFIIYVIKTAGKTILADAGCVTMPGFEMKNFIGSVNALENAGISPDDITDVIITHAHHDHIECVKEFENAVIHIQKDEYEMGKNYIPEGFKINIFDEQYSVCDGVKAVKVGGHSKGSCVIEINENDHVTVIVGDECYSRRCIMQKIPTGSSFCMQKSKEFIEKYSDCKYKLLFCHDEIL